MILSMLTKLRNSLKDNIFNDLEDLDKALITVPIGKCKQAFLKNYAPLL